MSKAKERAKERYSIVRGDDTQETSGIDMQRASDFIDGYEQAEKDLALTIEDIEKIHTFLYAIKHNKQGVFTFTRLSDEQYQEVLNRFNKQKEK